MAESNEEELQRLIKERHEELEKIRKSREQLAAQAEEVLRKNKLRGHAQDN